MLGKKIKFWPFLISLAIVISFIILKFNQLGAPEQPQEKQTPVLEDSEVRQNLVKDYLSSHINDLSPEKSQTNQSWEITETTFLDNNRILVNYQDDTDRLTARASYVLEPNQPLTISSFEVIKKNNELLGQPLAQIGNDDLAVVAVKNNLASKNELDFSQIELTIQGRDQYHLRGLASLAVETANPFLAALVNGEFQIVSWDDENFDCAELAAYNFSEELLPECAK